MTEMLDNIEQLKNTAKQELDAGVDSQKLEDWRIKYIGRNGAVPKLLRGIKDLPVDERKEAGAAANKLREELEDAYKQVKSRIGDDKAFAASERQVKVTGKAPGHLHPITLSIRKLRKIFTDLGFLIVEGPEIEEEKHNFDYLNINLEHPARAETDTFYIQDHADTVLRTHVSTLQTRAVFEHDLKPPFRIMYYDRCFRAEKTDPTHESTFHQFEFMVVEKDISLAHIKTIAEEVYSRFFQEDVNIRFRPAYFPFVEPGLEIDMSCVFCKSKGCRICKYSGWIEMAGAGSVHPNVLKNINVDPSEYQGIAMGAAIDRLAMLYYNIDDIRLFWSGDIRFLKQFS